MVPLILLLLVWGLIYLPVIIKPHKIEPFVIGFPFDLFWLLVLTGILLLLVIWYALVWNPEKEERK